MGYEVKITKWHAGVLIDIEDREKVMLKFGKDGCSRSEAIARAVHEAVKNVRLTKQVMDAIQKEYEYNYRKRMARREAIKNSPPGATKSGRRSPTYVVVPE